VTTILDLRRLLLAAADDLNLPLTERDVTALAHHVADHAATPPDGPRTITPARMEILRALAIGERTEETADRLCRSAYTIKTHRRLLYAELRARTGPHAVAIAMNSGLFDVDLPEGALSPLAAGGAR
jgi:DNA-binding CsgD family transcriptional regulator